MSHPPRGRCGRTGPVPRAYHPGVLVVDVLVALAAAGLRGVHVRDQAGADRAAADLLRALGVAPLADDGTIGGSP